MSKRPGTEAVAAMAETEARLMDQARVCYQFENYADAFSIYSYIAENNPTKVGIYYHLGR
jgi:hypothetical protein